MDVLMLFQDSRYSMMQFSELSQKFDDLVQLLQNKELGCRACGYREVHVLFRIFSESGPVLAIVSASNFRNIFKPEGVF
jgi:hypothetical protein